MKSRTITIALACLFCLMAANMIIASPTTSAKAKTQAIHSTRDGPVIALDVGHADRVINYIDSDSIANSHDDGALISGAVRAGDATRRHVARASDEQSYLLARSATFATATTPQQLRL